MSLLERVRGWLGHPIRPASPPAAPAASAASELPDVTEAPRERGPVRMDRLRAQLVLHEGKRRKVYPDTEGHPTIGIGRNLDAKPLSAREVAAIPLGDIAAGLTDEQIDLLFSRDVAEAVAALDRHLPWWRRLDEVRRRVLLDMMFNMGPGDEKKGLLSFRNTLENIRTGFYTEAAEGMLASKWARQTKTRADRLAAMMRTGQDWTI